METILRREGGTSSGSFSDRPKIETMKLKKLLTVRAGSRSAEKERE